MLWQARDWPARARLFPWTMGWPALALALVQLGVAVRVLFAPPQRVGSVERSAGPARDVGPADTAAEARAAGEAEEPEIPPDLARRRALEMSAWIFAFTAGVVLFGFKIGAAGLALTFLRLAARESWVTSVAIALSIYLFFLLIFEVGLNIQLPMGFVPDTFGFEWPDAQIVQLLMQLMRGG